LLGIVLRGEGFETAAVSDGDPGVRRLPGSFKSRNLVLLDLMLPGRDGIDVCRQIRAESGVPIVMLTAKSDHRGRGGRGLEFRRPTTYVIKPVQSRRSSSRGCAARLRRADEPQAGDAEHRRPVDRRGRALGQARAASPSR